MEFTLIQKKNSQNPPLPLPLEMADETLLEEKLIPCMGWRGIRRKNARCFCCRFSDGPIAHLKAAWQMSRENILHTSIRISVVQ